MKQPLSVFITLLFVAGIFFVVVNGKFLFPDKSAFEEWRRPFSEGNKEANEDFFLVRAYPDLFIDPVAYHAVVKSALTAGNSTREEKNWMVEGPGNIGGRINCMAIDPDNNNIMFVGNASGGVYKTTDGGASWFPVFDDQPYLAIGAITIDPTDPQTIWVGTGDLNISGYPFIGDGIYKSTDGGINWSHMGLEAQSIISKIIVDPANPDIIYASAMGVPFFESTDRGLYKSTDGGLTWSQKLFVSVNAGIIDMVQNPGNPQVLYAASWNRIRNSEATMVSGPDANIYKSTDGGNNWIELSNGLPGFNTSRIGLAISSQNPDKLYAIVVDTTFIVQGIYKTTNGGSLWSNATGNFDQYLFGSQGWYFGKIYVNPANDHEIYVPGVDLQRSTNEGSNWSPATPPWWTYEVHADGHYMDFIDGNTFFYCTDGGLYKTQNNCVSWSDAEDIPNTQFYRVSYNPHVPDKSFGGAQDNGTTAGNVASINSWSRIYGGDGFKPIFDPDNNELFYVETQNGGLAYTTTGGLSFNDFTSGIDYDDRRSWDMPYIMSASDNSTFYCGTYRVYKRTNAPGGTWTSVSPDLTDGVIFGERFHVITSIAQSSFNSNYLYAGTSDGNVWSSENGTTWNNVTGTLPERYITSVHASSNFSNNVYVTHSGYKSNEFIPHVHKSINNGQDWIDISGDLPQWAVNDIQVLPGNEEKIFVATDGGVYYTLNSGVNWYRLGANMPIVAVYDIELNPAKGSLIAGTFGRSIWTIDISDITGVEQEITNSIGLQLYPNPVNDVLNIMHHSLEKRHIAVYSAAGKQVLSTSLEGNASTLKLSVSHLPKGVYFLRISDNEEEITGKFLKVE